VSASCKTNVNQPHYHNKHMTLYNSLHVFTTYSHCMYCTTAERRRRKCN